MNLRENITKLVTLPDKIQFIQGKGWARVRGLAYVFSGEPKVWQEAVITIVIH